MTHHRHALYHPVGATDIDPPELTDYGKFIERETDRLYTQRIHDADYMAQLAQEAFLLLDRQSNEVALSMLKMIQDGGHSSELGRTLQYRVLTLLNEKCEQDAIDAWDAMEDEA